MNRIPLGLLIGLGACTLAHAQVYRCESGGKTIYTDAPCLGAKKVDATPTQGMDKWSGTSRKGADVRRDEWQKMLTDSTRPLHGRSHEEMKPRYRRTQNNLTPAEHAECELLDGSLRGLEAQESRAQGEGLKDVQLRLLKQRQRYRELKC